MTAITALLTENWPLALAGIVCAPLVIAGVGKLLDYLYPPLHDDE